MESRQNLAMGRQTNMRSLLQASILFFASFLIAVHANAIVDGHEYQFTEGDAVENESRAELFKQLAEELRCPKCQNQNLADSNAMIAQDLRRELYSQVKEGKGEQDIIDFMVDRYGEFVLYKPAMNEKTIVLWYGPIALLILAIVVFLVVVLTRRAKSKAELSSQTVSQEDAPESISAEEQARIDALLNADEKDSKGDN